MSASVLFCCSGKFPLHQIRMLPPDHPHVEYDTSTVIASGRRRSTIPETPPIMTTPPDHRGRVSQPNPPKGKVPTGATAKKVKKSKPSHLSRAEVFDESTDDEEPVVGVYSSTWEDNSYCSVYIFCVVCDRSLRYLPAAFLCR